MRYELLVGLRYTRAKCRNHFIDGVFDATATGGAVFHAATGLETNAIAQVQAQLRRWLLRVFVRRVLLPGDDARARMPPSR